MDISQIAVLVIMWALTLVMWALVITGKRHWALLLITAGTTLATIYFTGAAVGFYDSFWEWMNAPPTTEVTG